jgi:hypothetical protein
LRIQETPLRSNKASQDVSIALTVTNDVKDPVGRVAIASTRLVAAVCKSRSSEARES